MNSTSTRWTAARARDWYAGLPWLVGCNFTPAYAINQLEMWQPETFDPKAIARELDWAASIGFNTVRTFLHDLCYTADRAGFLRRIDTFLDIAAQRGIRVMPVFFDSVWHPYPRAGAQRDPEPFVHNSGWVQSPGVHVLRDEKAFDQLEKYVVDIVSTFRDDDRVLIWDLWNEPDNSNVVAYGNRDIAQGKDEIVRPLLMKVFDWARSAAPTQPLTCAVWGAASEQLTPTSKIAQLQLEASDVISFHSYTAADACEKTVAHFERFERPLLCTEFMARKVGSTFHSILPLFKKHNVGAYCWGLVAGRSQTNLPWDTWSSKYEATPELWFHDVFHEDGRPYRQDEVDFIRALTGRPTLEPSVGTSHVRRVAVRA